MNTFCCKLLHTIELNWLLIKNAFIPSELSSSSAELLFEVYDRAVTLADGQHKFLGLGLVGIDELAVGPASSQILALQPRPYETEKVSGAIYIEVSWDLFYNGSNCSKLIYFDQRSRFEILVNSI